MTHKRVRQNFLYPEIKETDRTYAGVAEVINPEGDWRPFLPPEELQNIRGIESSSCYVEAQQHSIATLQEQKFLLPDQNYSARFNALLSGGTENGGDPIKGIKSIKYDGCVPDDKMPFGEDLHSFEDFHSWKGVNLRELRDLGKRWASEWRVGFKIVAEQDDPIKTKYLKLRGALKRSPVSISVTAWFEENGEYIKPEGMSDNHLCTAIYVDEKDRIFVRDTYFPFTKMLTPQFNFDFAMGYNLTRDLSGKKSICDLIKGLWK